MDFTAIGQQLGLNEQQTRAAFEALAPVVAAGMRHSSEAGGGLGDLLGGLGGGSGLPRYAQDPSSLSTPGAVDDGNAILGQIFGSKDVSRGVAQKLSASSGIGESIIKKLLPIVAAYVMSQIAAKAANGGLGDILGSILGSGQNQSSSQGGSGGGLGDILGSVLGGGAQQGSGGGGLGDILGGMLGGGEPQEAAPPARRGTAPQGGGLDDILRDVLGGGSASSGSPADELLNAVKNAISRR